MPQNSQTPLLSIRDLEVSFHGQAGVSQVLTGVSLDMEPGEILGLVGESGCGKSVLAQSILSLLPSPPAQMRGEILWRGENLLTVPARRMRAVRGGEISMIFQEPMTSLNPVFTVGQQMVEVLRQHKKLSRREAKTIAQNRLHQVNMPDPERTLAKYPHELSGGMRQRVMIAMELSCGPDLLIADEPTTALDVTVQGQVLALLANLAQAENVAVLFITHDMGVVAQLCQRVAVMYAGSLVELVPVLDLFRQPLHPYSQGLIAAIPTLTDTRELLPSIPGSVPNLIHPPQGCRFHPRCERCTDLCRTQVPALHERQARHFVACHHVPTLTSRG